MRVIDISVRACARGHTEVLEVPEVLRHKANGACLKAVCACVN